MNKYKIALFICAFAWGFGYVAMDHLVATTSITLAIGLRFFFASLIILSFSFKKVRSQIKGNIKYSIILGVILFLAFAFQTLGLVITTTSKNAFLTATNVIWVPVILSLFYKQSIAKKIYVSSILMIIGVGFVSLDGISSFNVGDVVTLIGAFFFGLHMVYIGKFANSDNVDFIVFGQLFITGVLGILSTFLVDGFTLNMGSEFLISILFAAFISTALCFFLQNYGIVGVDSSLGALILSLEAMFGVIATVLIDGEIINIITIVGFLIMFGAIIVAEYKT